MVVLIKESGPLKKVVTWRMGRIIEVIPGRDGSSRRIRLKTKTGEITRDIRHLALLEGMPTLEQQERSFRLKGEEEKDE